MRNRFLLLMIGFFMNSCAQDVSMPGYRFDNFKGTSNLDLAKAIQHDEIEKVREILKKKENDLDLKDPFYNQTLLALTIVNKKEDAFIELLNHGANPNEICGNNNEFTPFLHSIDFSENCNSFYIEQLLIHGADINKEIKYIDRNGVLKQEIPIFHAINKSRDNGDECIDLVKFFVNNGANLNVCYQNPMTDLCEGIIYNCLYSKSIDLLKYFVIEKKIAIPKIVYTKGSIDKSNVDKYTLIQILETSDYDFDDIPELKKSKDEVLIYLRNKK